jgi:hypothetical protein
MSTISIKETERNGSKTAGRNRGALPMATSASSRLTCRPMSSILPLPRIASHWAAPHEIHPGEWQEAAPKALLRVLFPADRSRLPARSRNEPHLLRSRLLRRSLQECRPGSSKSSASIVGFPRVTSNESAIRRRTLAAKEDMNLTGLVRSPSWWPRDPLNNQPECGRRRKSALSR